MSNGRAWFSARFSDVSVFAFCEASQSTRAITREEQSVNNHGGTLIVKEELFLNTHTHTKREGKLRGVPFHDNT